MGRHSPSATFRSSLGDRHSGQSNPPGPSRGRGPGVGEHCRSSSLRRRRRGVVQAVVAQARGASRRRSVRALRPGRGGGGAERGRQDDAVQDLAGVRAARQRALSGRGLGARRVPASAWRGVRSGAGRASQGVDGAGPACPQRGPVRRARGARRRLRPRGRDGSLRRRHARKEAAKCSNGTQRRLWFACALAGDPAVLVLDEPFAGLDPPARRALRSEVRAARDRGVAVLVASHELAEVERVADTVVLLRDGGTSAPRDLARSDRDPEAAPAARLEAELFGGNE